MSAQSKPLHLTVASSNPGKLREYRALADSAGASIELALIPNFDALPKFDEAANTFAENAMGKALHYSHFSDGLVIADDSGLVVPALGGAPGAHSARYAGPGASDADRIRKLLDAMRGKKGEARGARFDERQERGLDMTGNRIVDLEEPDCVDLSRRRGAGNGFGGRGQTHRPRPLDRNPVRRA